MADDAFLKTFDRFVKWPLRLKKEGPFIESFLEAISAKKVVDAGAGTGRHAVHLAERGYEVTAADVASCMVEETGRFAREKGVTVNVVRCAFADLAEHVPGSQDAVICLGNSLAMLPDAEGVRRSLSAFARVLRPGGVILLHLLNYVGLRAQDKRISRPTPLEDGGLLVKFFDLEPGATRVNFLHLFPSEGGSWKSEHRYAPLLPLSREEVEAIASEAGFSEFEFFGGADGSPYDRLASFDLFTKAVLSP
ncbi:MAG: class I SAM-dependent methyltransferase [Planctomycetota bacterium]